MHDVIGNEMRWEIRGNRRGLIQNILEIMKV